MKEKKAVYKLTHGMYVLACNSSACIVDAVCQISGSDNPLISVAVNKNNFTNERLHIEDKFSLAIISLDDDPSLIKNFGMQSMRNTDKFASSPNPIAVVEGVKVIQNTMAYLVLEKVDAIENETHTLFIGRVIEGDINHMGEAMTYSYYQQHKDELLKVKTEQGKTAWVCTICGYVYYGETLPDDYHCPICGVGSDMFVKQ